MKTRIALILFLLLPCVSWSQWIEDAAIDKLIRQGIKNTYDINFDAAEKSFRSVIQSRPDHPAGHFFLAMVDWWRILIDMDNASRDQGFYSKLDKVIEMCNARLDRNDRDVTGLFFKAGSIGFKGQLLAYRKSWFRVAAEGKDALSVVQEVERVAPNNADISLGSGIYSYYAAVLPDAYPVLKPFMLFLPKGNRAKGLKQLRFAVDKGRYANYEAMHFLMLAFYNAENKPEQCLAYAQKLHALFPNNPVFHKYVARAQVRLGNWKETVKTCRDMLKSVYAKHAGYDRHLERESIHYLGLDAFERKDYGEAMKNFLKTDELSRSLDTKETSAYMVLANLRMGMIHDALGQRSFAVKQYDKVLKLRDYSGSRDLAKKYKQAAYKG